jgi:hypothetical protein
MMNVLLYILFIFLCVCFVFDVVLLSMGTTVSLLLMYDDNDNIFIVEKKKQQNFKIVTQQVVTR